MWAVSISPEITIRIDEIRDDRAHGASELARRAAEVIRLAAESSQAEDASKLLQDIESVGRELQRVRPAMAPLYNIVGRLLDSLPEAEGDVAALRELVAGRAEEQIAASLRAVSAIAGHACGLASKGSVVLTHSYSSTVTAALIAAGEEHNISVMTTRSGPGRSGERTARELGKRGVKVTFIDDTAVSLYMSGVNQVWVGADRVCADGCVVNGVGTCQVALAAARAGVPLYALCETLKFDPGMKPDDVDLEEKDPAEVAGPGSLPGDVRVRNPYFDITPPDLVAGIITDNGLLSGAEITVYIQDMAHLV